MSVGPTCHRELLAIRGLWHTAAEDLWQQLRIHLAAGAARSTQHKAHRTAGVHANGQGFKRGRGRHATQTVLHPAQAGTTGRRAWSQPAMHACRLAVQCRQAGVQTGRQTDTHLSAELPPIFSSTLNCDSPWRVSQILRGRPTPARHTCASKQARSAGCSSIKLLSAPPQLRAHGDTYLTAAISPQPSQPATHCAACLHEEEDHLARQVSRDAVHIHVPPSCRYPEAPRN